MSFSRLFYNLIFFVLIASGLDARSSLYRRAQNLVETDPIEAEAMMARFIADEAGSDKTKRAAAFELFSLRLRNGRLTEAFFHAKSAAFRKRLQSAVEENVRISAENAHRLIMILRSVCTPEGDTEKIAHIFEQHKYPVAAYDFAIRILDRCKAQDISEIFPEFPPEDAAVDNKAVQLAILESREAITAEDYEMAEALLAAIRTDGAAILSKEPALLLQLDFTEARFMAKKEDFAGLKARCVDIDRRKPPRTLRNACRFLTAFALMKEGAYSAAYAKISGLKIEPNEIDGRLLRLSAAVAAGEAPRKNLEKFMRRYSYKECAPVLRILAKEILELPSANR